MAPSAVIASWLAAAAAVPAVLVGAAGGQGLGTVLVGGRWIGICVPWDKQPWGLVNQPVLNFASTPSAAAYWLGGSAVVLGVAVSLMPATVRVRSLAGQLAAVQLAFAAAVVGLLWQPGLDPTSSHVARWLAFRGLPPELRWLAAAVGAAVAVPIVLRLVALARITRFALRRSRRLGLVVLHLVPVPLGWAAVSTTVRGSVPVEACVVAVVPFVVALLTAWFGFPPAATHAVSGIRPRAAVVLAVIALTFAGLAMAVGRPLPGGRTAAVQWARGSSFNNIRPWMVPLRAPWLGPVGTPSSR
jgi:hypothetical protein